MMSKFLASNSNKTPAKALKKKRNSIPFHLTILWAIIGTMLTVSSTFFQPFVVMSAAWGSPSPIIIQPISTTLQIGAVLLTGCLGGRNAGLLSQIAYLTMGLSGLPVFYGGGGLDYVRSPAFGYLLGFLPGAWFCGLIAFAPRPPNLEQMTISCLFGLACIHLVGISYILLTHLQNLALAGSAILQFSGIFLSGQLIVVCATVVLATAMRWLLTY